MVHFPSWLCSHSLPNLSHTSCQIKHRALNGAADNNRPPTVGTIELRPPEGSLRGNRWPPGRRAARAAQPIRLPPVQAASPDRSHARAGGQVRWQPLDQSVMPGCAARSTGDSANGGSCVRRGGGKASTALKVRGCITTAAGGSRSGNPRRRPNGDDPGSGAEVLGGYSTLPSGDATWPG